MSLHPKIHAMMRVDHAGEHGAVKIYDGQLAVFRHSKHHQATHDLIADMAAQEQAHLDYFDALLARENIRPTALRPLWDVAGLALGAATALLGEKAAMACTAAVETEIDAHYQAQLETLEGLQNNPETTAIAEKIRQFQADEAAHRQTALEQGAEQAPAYPLMSALIRMGCRAAIKISEKI